MLKVEESKRTKYLFIDEPKKKKIIKNIYSSMMKKQIP